MLRLVGLGCPLLIVLMCGATAVLITLVGAGRDVFVEDCFGAEVFAGDFPDEDLEGVFLVAIVFYVLCILLN